MSSNNYLLTGGRLLDPKAGLDAPGDVLIVDGHIAKVGKVGDDVDALPIDCKGLVLCPGFVDICCHLRDPGNEDAETIETGSKAAVKGGFTAVAATPDTVPVNDTRAVTEYILREAQATALCKVYPVGALTVGLRGEQLAEIGELETAGAVAISTGDDPLISSETLRRVSEYLQPFSLPWFHRSYDPSLAPLGLLHEGRISTRIGMAGIPSEAEFTAIYRDLAIVTKMKRPIHFSHISTAEGLKLIKEAKRKGLPVTRSEEHTSELQSH